MLKSGAVFALLIFFCNHSFAQEDSLYSNWKHKKNIFTLGLYKQPGADSMVDFWDGVYRIFGKRKKEEAAIVKPQLSLIPSVEYSLITGIAASVNSNIVFPKKKNNSSFIYMDAKQTIKKQSIFEVVSNFWFADDRYNFNSDWSIMKFPQKDFGLGGNSSLNLYDQLNYSYLKLHQSISRRVAKDFYIGAGIKLDYHWNIIDTSSIRKPVTGFREYGFTSRSLSSGYTLNVLYDSRRNAVHPVAGETYFQSSFRNNPEWLGSDQSWSAMTIDARKYLAFPLHSKNILAFWSYNVFTTNGLPPYLDLPHTAVDPFKNTGRGYIQGRYRGKNLLMQEVEYRFGITENGFLGGVVYGNVQSVSDFRTNKLSSPIPGYGIGLRVKFNKKSNTSIALDYAWGREGSRGFFMNLGEVF